MHMPITPETVAIGLTAFLQLVGLLILSLGPGRLVRENGRMLEHLEGIDAAIYLQGRQMKQVIEEVRNFLLTESAHSPRT